MTDRRIQPVRVGVIGLGRFGMLHAQTLRGLPESELVALVDTEEGRVEQAKSALPGVPVWTDFDKAIDKSGAEAWVVATPPNTHVRLTRELLEQGQSVLLEKPVAASLAEAKELSPLVKADSSNLMLGHILLFSSENRALFLEAKSRGPLVYIQTVRHRAAPSRETFPENTLFELLMVHDLYLVFALANGAEPTKFSAQTHCTSSGAIDLANGQLVWDDGLIANLTVSSLTTPGMSGEGFDRFEVFGKGWVARVEPTPRPIQIWDDKVRWPLGLDIIVDPLPPVGIMADELRAFCQVVRGQAPVRFGATYQDALTILGWVEKLREAAKER